jgi:CelD/BcsL family acetyltransferase involved in cellulose biosynthesis
VNVTVVHPNELGPDERRAWDRFGREPALGSPFLSWQFTRIVGHLRDDARVAVIHEDGENRGFLAFQVGPHDTGAPLGATIADAQAVMCRADWGFDPRQVISAAGLARWQFDHLVTAQVPFFPYHHQRHRSPVVHLQLGYDQFLQGLRAHSKDLLAQVGRRRRNLERDAGPVWCEWQSTRHQEDLRDLMRWKSEQYDRARTWDRFEQPWIAEAVARLAESRDPACTGTLTALRAGDRLVAAHFGLLGRDRLSWWFPAYDPNFGRYSPGLILLLDIIAEASRRAVPVVDLGRGEHSYKLRVTSDFYEVAEGEVSAVGA